MDTRFNQTKLKKLQIFNGAQLKYLAFASMLIDHVRDYPKFCVNLLCGVE